MEVQAHTEVPQHQQIIVPYATVEKLHDKHKRQYKYVSPMALLRLLWSTELRHQDLAPPERAILSVLLTYISLEKASQQGIYDAYPSMKSIVALTGICDRAARDHKKSLEAKDWVKIHSGTGKGKNNHYYINAPKIVSCYEKSNPEDGRWYRTGKDYDEIESEPFPINRNTSGLRQGPTCILEVPSTVQ